MLLICKYIGTNDVHRKFFLEIYQSCLVNQFSISRCYLEIVLKPDVHNTIHPKYKK